MDIRDLVPKAPTKGDTAVTILGGVAGFFADVLVIHFPGIPVGTFSVLCGAAAVGVKKGVEAVRDTLWSEQEIDEETALVARSRAVLREKAEAILNRLRSSSHDSDYNTEPLLSRLEFFMDLWLDNVLADERFENELDKIIDEYVKLVMP